MKRKNCANCKHSDENPWSDNLLICTKLREVISIVDSDVGIDIEYYNKGANEYLFEVNKNFGCNNFESK